MSEAEERGVNREKMKRLAILALTAFFTGSIGYKAGQASAPPKEKAVAMSEVTLKGPINCVISQAIPVRLDHRLEVVPVTVGPDGKPIKPVK